MCCFDLQRNEEALRSENSNIGICEYKVITGDNKMINQDLYEMIFKRKSFHLFRNVGDKRLSIKEIEDIKKNNDYAMWLKVCNKANCYLLKEELAMYRKRNGSISNHSYFVLIKWHYKLYRSSEKQNIIRCVFNTFRNMIFGFYKKKRYVSKNGTK